MSVLMLLDDFVVEQAWNMFSKQCAGIPGKKWPTDSTISLMLQQSPFLCAELALC